MAERYFADGPWEGKHDDDYQAVPAQRIPVYADASDFEGQCGDEQVTKLLGHYERMTPVLGAGIFSDRPDGYWAYGWKEMQ